MCNYCDGLGYVISLADQVKPCPICTDAGRREWVEANLVNAHIHVLRFGLVGEDTEDEDTDDDTYEDTFAANDAVADGDTGSGVSHLADAESAAIRDSDPDGFWLAERAIPDPRHRAPATHSGLRARASARPRHPAVH